MRLSIWQNEHVDFLEQLVRGQALTAQEMATQMSRRFHRRITPQQVAALLGRMRTHSDPFYRNIPYRRGARFVGYTHGVP